MDISTILREVETWPLNERVQLVEAIWNGVAEENVQPELSDDQRQELDRRLEALKADTDDVISWDDVQQFVRRPR